MLVTFLPINHKIEVEAGSNLFEIAKNHGIDLNGICSGNKTCGKCKVLITRGNSKEFTKEELNLLTLEERSSGIRLACCFTIYQDTCVIMLNYKQEKQVKAQLQYSWKDDSKYGIAFDLGTTTVAAMIWNLNSRKCLGKRYRQNPQCLYGADVISRISYANKREENLDTLCNSIRTCCNELIYEFIKDYKINKLNITSAVIAGNTAMTHLYLGNSVDCLAKVPFEGVTYQGEDRLASILNLDINPDSIVHIMPGIGGFVGSDTLGCILYKELAEFKGNCLLVDIGTNGEIVLAKDGKLTACSTAAGPAFEGASLYQGMRAAKGAITAAKIEDGEFIVDYIGSEKQEIIPCGICGSGVIEVIAELYKYGIMDENGRLLGNAGEQNYVTLWEDGKNKVILTQKDIREFQLAKGAIITGIQLLLREGQIPVGALDKIYLAGEFGSSINIKKAISIGLIPEININLIEYIGNGALAGASEILLGNISKLEAERISKNTSHLELALYSDFEQIFIQSVTFPKK